MVFALPYTESVHVVILPVVVISMRLRKSIGKFTNIKLIYVACVLQKIKMICNT